MANTLEPRSVTLKDIPDWLRESWALFTRRASLLLLMSILYHYLALSSETFGVFALLAALLLCQVAISIVIVAAEAADFSRGVSAAALYSLVKNIMGALIVLTLFYAAIYLAGAAVVLTLDLELPSSGGSAAPSAAVLTWLSLGFTAFLILYMGIAISTLWFVMPLIALNELRLRDAAILAKRAEGKNQWVVFLVSYVPCVGLCLASVLSTWTVLVSVIALPLFGIFQYVAYRHVFLGRKANKPVLVSNYKLATTPALE